jgi:hypothetical protein
MDATNNPATPKGHFYMSSIATWVTTGPGRSLTEAVRLMDSEKLTYMVWYIPHPPETPYEIRFYAPQVEGAECVDFVGFDKRGRRVKFKSDRKVAI